MCCWCALSRHTTLAAAAAADHAERLLYLPTWHPVADGGWWCLCVLVWLCVCVSMSMMPMAVDECRCDDEQL